LGTLIGALNTAGTGSSGVTPWQNIMRGIFGSSGTSGINWSDPSSWFSSTPSITSGSDGTVNDSGVWGTNPMTGGTVIDNGTGGQADTTP
jgi:hypothetical protein